MHPILITILSALATGFLLILALFIESRTWQHESKSRLAVPTWGEGVWGKILSGILVLAILGALGMLGYSVATPAKERFTEFYLLGLSGKADDYPAQLAVGEEGKVMVNIINREYETATYHVEVKIDGVTGNELEPVTLEHDEKWEAVVGFTPDRAGDNQKVEFLLYRQGQSEVYHSLYFWLDVQ